MVRERHCERCGFDVSRLESGDLMERGASEGVPRGPAYCLAIEGDDPPVERLGQALRQGAEAGAPKAAGRRAENVVDVRFSVNG